MPDRSKSCRRSWLGKAALLLAGTGLATALGAGAGMALLGMPGSARAEGPAPAQAVEVPRRLMSLGGTLTEIVYALGAGELLVGVDASSLYPPEARKLPEVGYFRQFSVEGVAALRPDLVIAGEGAGPPAAVSALKQLGIRLEMFALEPNVPSLSARIVEVARLLGREPQGEELVARIDAQVKRATAEPRPVRVLVLSSHAGKLQGAGRDTAIDAQLRMLGAKNLLADSHKGYKPLSGEAVAALQPDVIITSIRSAPDGASAFRQQPGVMATPAGRNNRIVLMEDLLLLGFGPRVGESLEQLATALADGGVASPAGSGGTAVRQGD